MEPVILGVRPFGAKKANWVSISPVLAVTVPGGERAQHIVKVVLPMLNQTESEGV